jgi:hypothetical protein
MDNVAVNNAAKEVYFVAVTESGAFVLVYDPVSLKLKNTTTIQGTFLPDDIQWDPTLNGGTLVAFGSTQDSSFSVATLDLMTGKATVKILFKMFEDVAENTFGYDSINHRYIVSGGTATGCEYLLVDTQTFKVVNSFKYNCFSGNEGDRTPDNAAYSPVTNQLVGFINASVIFAWNLTSETLTKLFDVSDEGTFRILGPSMMVTDPTGSFDTYYSVMSTHAPVLTYLISVKLPKTGQPSWTASPKYSNGDIFGLIAPISVSS